MDLGETPRNLAFCAHAINEPEKIMLVPDSRQDERFYDNPFVTDEPKVVFYAGVPLVTNKGYALGTLCVIDMEPHVLDENQLTALRALSNNVVRLFELRKNKLELERAHSELQRKNNELERFAAMAAHDLKSPLANISSITDLLTTEYGGDLCEEALDLVGLLSQSSQQLRELIDGILEHSRSDELLKAGREEVLLPQIFKEALGLLNVKNVEVTYPSGLHAIKTNSHALKQILINLISNGIAYNNKPHKTIDLGFDEDEEFYRFSVTDNGMGIPKAHQERIFNLFERLTPHAEQAKGHGIGLSTVKKLVENMGGEVKVNSTVGEGTTFSFTLAK